MKKLIASGSTSQRVQVFIQNSASLVGAGLGGLVYNTSGLTAYYFRDGDSGTTAISLVTATLGTWASGGFVAVDGTNLPGVYEIGLPNACFSGGGSCVVYLQGAANMVPCVLEIQESNVPANVAQIAGQTASAAGGVTFPGSIGTSTFASGGSVNATQIGGQAVALDGNNLLNVNVTDWNGNSITGGTLASVNVIKWNGNAAQNGGSGFPKVDASYIAGQAAALDANNFLKVDVADIGGVSTGTVMLSGTGVYSSASLANAPTGSGGPTTAQIATAVWEDLILGGDFATTGSIGKLLATYTTPPSAASIAAAIQSLGAISFTIVSPLMQNGSLTLVRGDDYFNADGRAITFTFSAGSQPNLTGATIALSGKISQGNENAGASSYSTAGVVSAGGSGQQTVYVELSTTLTAGLAIGAMAYDFALIATLSDGHVVTLSQGTLTVKAQE